MAVKNDNYCISASSADTGGLRLFYTDPVCYGYGVSLSDANSKIKVKPGDTLIKLATMEKLLVMKTDTSESGKEILYAWAQSGRDVDIEEGESIVYIKEINKVQRTKNVRDAINKLNNGIGHIKPIGPGKEKLKVYGKIKIASRF